MATAVCRKGNMQGGQFPSNAIKQARSKEEMECSRALGFHSCHCWHLDRLFRGCNKGSIWRVDVMDCRSTADDKSGIHLSGQCASRYHSHRCAQSTAERTGREGLQRMKCIQVLASASISAGPNRISAAWLVIVSNTLRSNMILGKEHRHGNLIVDDAANRTSF